LINIKIPKTYLLLLLFQIKFIV